MGVLDCILLNVRIMRCVSTQIPTKIEVFVGFLNGASAGSTDAAGAAAEAGSMRRLGYLSFDSNERSNHQARELKSVHVTVEAELVRLVIHRCHVNKLNIYNQVGPVVCMVPWPPAHPMPMILFTHSKSVPLTETTATCVAKAPRLLKPPSKQDAQSRPAVLKPPLC
jgi:hypothetical protein